jgi:hypothetical protein
LRSFGGAVVDAFLKQVHVASSPLVFCVQELGASEHLFVNMSLHSASPLQVHVRAPHEISAPVGGAGMNARAAARKIADKK